MLGLEKSLKFATLSKNNFICAWAMSHFCFFSLNAVSVPQMQ